MLSTNGINEQAQQHPPPPQLHATTPSTTAPGCASYCAWTGWLLTFFLLILFILFIHQHNHHPINPVIQISTLSFSNLNFSSSQTSYNQLTADWNVDFDVRNFNMQTKRDGYAFSKISVSIFMPHTVDDGMALWTSTLPPFQLDAKNVTTHLTCKFSGSSGSVDQPTMSTFDTVIGGRMTDKGLKFDVKLQGVVDINAHSHDLTAYCTDIELFVNSEMRRGSMLSPSEECDVKINWWY